jgi:crossover junction endodeoxyribonuclease RuvC
VNVIGIDPGVSGAIAHWSGSGMLGVHDMPTVERIVNGKKRRTVNPAAVADIITGCGPVDLVVLELAAARPGEGSVSSHTNGRNFGVVEGVLATLERPYRIVSPREWTKALGVGSDKGNHRLEAMRLFPTAADLFTRVKDDGRADAALLAHYAARFA